MRKYAAAVAAAVTILAVSFAAAVATGSPVSSDPAREPLAAVGVPDVAGAIRLAVEYVHFVEVVEIESAIGDLQVAVGAFVADIIAQEVWAAEQAAEAAARQVVVLAPQPGYQTPAASSPTSGGGHSDAWWQGVANCEQGGRNDPYFGYFSFMDGSQGGKPWAEQVAAGNALLQTAGREVGPWAQACVNAGYAASPGG